jgi:hypothetical protein
MCVAEIEKPALGGGLSSFSEGRLWARKSRSKPLKNIQSTKEL